MSLEVLSSAEVVMRARVVALGVDLAKLRTGRAHTGLLDHIKVDYYGVSTSIPNMASISLKDARTITVSCWSKGYIPAIDRAIRDSGLGLNPAVHGDTILVPMPALTQERRKVLGKIVREQGEAARISIRGVRRDAIQHLDKLPEDEKHRLKNGLQKVTDTWIAAVDELIEQKQADLLVI